LNYPTTAKGKGKKREVSETDLGAIKQRRSVEDARKES